jgi:hypothetical protein
MEVLVTFAVLGSALHATWSTIAYRFREQELGFAMLAWVSTGCYVVVLPFVPAPAPASRPYLAASVVLHVVLCTAADPSTFAVYAAASAHARWT